MRQAVREQQDNRENSPRPGGGLESPQGPHSQCEGTAVTNGTRRRHPRTETRHEPDRGGLANEAGHGGLLARLLDATGRKEPQNQS
jgi:hypothetical protein